MKLVLLQIDNLRPQNPRFNRFKIEKMCYYKNMDPKTMPPIRVRGRDIVDGDHRYWAAKLSGRKQIWGYVLDEHDK